MQNRLLIVEDDIALQRVLIDLLQDEGFLTEAVSTGAKALHKLDKTLPHLVLLDLGLPDIQGETVLAKIRSDFPELPVVILTAKSKPHQIAQGLNLGADDYLPKPFAVEELLARINARLKLTSRDQTMPLAAGDVRLDQARKVAFKGKSKVELTKREFELLQFLLENKGRVLSRDIILNHVWDYPTEVESRVVDIYIGYLRKKIDTGNKPKLIRNKRGFGYYISDK